MDKLMQVVGDWDAQTLMVRQGIIDRGREIARQVVTRVNETSICKLYDENDELLLWTAFVDELTGGGNKEVDENAVDAIFNNTGR